MKVYAASSRNALDVDARLRVSRRRHANGRIREELAAGITLKQTKIDSL
jgi:hypothetical protein